MLSNVAAGHESVHMVMNSTLNTFTDIKRVQHPGNTMPQPGAWAKGLKGSAAAEWLVDCYRMRVDDDFVWSGGMQRGLYHPNCTAGLLALDFFIFARLATLHWCGQLVITKHSLKNL
jgi:hypothetical protein